MLSRRAISLTLAAAAVLAAGGCDRDVIIDPQRTDTVEPVASASVAPIDGPVAFHVHLDNGQRLIMNDANSTGCPAMSGRIVLGANRIVSLTAFLPQCATSDNGSPGNGRHGVYRTSADIPAGRTTTTAPTPLGEATLFTQPYYECTNSCKHYTEPVAVIALSSPGDNGVRALVVVGDRGAVDQAALTTLIHDQLTP
ncbi:hypothetical protein [Dactylosporangium sp. CS-033363]|uniref:hypothetical protein n=1 Tax=Dactylosporangium sp. CS-033363 TaxID=3239935 RepID=UPI003D91B3FF